MIPYWAQPAWNIGPWTIHAFGLAQAVALIVGYVLALRRARDAGLDPSRTSGLFVAAVVVGLAVGFLAQHYLSGSRWTQAGQSVTGLVAGAFAVAFGAWMRWGSFVLPHLDILASVAPVLGGIARFGCFLAHDHPGRPSSGPFAVQFPEGARIDLGLIQCLAAFALAWPIWRLWIARIAPGLVAVAFAGGAIAVLVVSALLK